MYLSYSGYKKAKSCEFQYFHGYINRTPPPKPDNKVNSLFGTVIGKVVEAFYKEKLWKDPNVLNTLLLRVEPYLNQTILEEVSKGGVIDWQDRFSSYKDKDGQVGRDLLIQDTKDAVLRALKIIQYHKLIGPETDAEVKLDGDFQGHRIAGRADIILTRMKPFNDLLILDGKGSKYRERDVDPDQLKWYAFLYRAKFNKNPSRLGFVYWRSEPEDAIDWIEVKDEELDSLQGSVLSTIERIEQKKRHLTVLYPQLKQRDASLNSSVDFEKVQANVFPATPVSKKECGYCNYLGVCQVGTDYLASKKKKSILTSGVTEIGLDDD